MQDIYCNLKSIFSIILSLFVITGSIGTPLSVHHCFSSESTEVGFDKADSCCGNKKQQKKADDACCSFTSTYLQVDFEAFSNAGDFKFIAPFVVNELTYEIPVKDFTEGATYNYSKINVPKPAGRQLLTLVQTFLI